MLTSQSIQEVAVVLSSTNGDQVGLCQGSNNPHFNVITLLTIYLAAIYRQGEEHSSMEAELLRTLE